MSEALIIIPARGGSKRIPRKNIKSFAGHPIIFYPINAALKANINAKVIVSTEDTEIASIAKKEGAEIPFLRSNENSSDHATTAEVLTEVINNYAKLGEMFEYCCCLYPTSPLITAKDLEDSFHMLKSQEADSVVSVVEFEYPIQRSLSIQNEKLVFSNEKHLFTRSQDLEKMYHDAGQFYWMRTEAFLKSHRLFTNNTMPFILNRLVAQDIDTEEDWKLAELKFKLLHSKA